MLRLNILSQQIRNKWEPQCLDSNGDTLGKAIIGYVCHGQGGNQVINGRLSFMIKQLE